MQAAEVQRASRRPTNDLAAYDLYLRAYALMLSPARRVPEVLSLLDRAIERDPDFGPALAWAAICHFVCIENGWSETPEDDRRKGVQRARRALQLAGDDPDILVNAAFALTAFGEEAGEMIALADRALALNPSSARCWHASGGIRLYAGKPDDAVQYVENSLRLSPRARVGWGLAVMGTAHFLSGHFDEAVAKLRLAIQEDPDFPMAHRSLAACYAHMGRLEDARAALGRLRAICPIVIPLTLMAYHDPRHRELLLSGLRLAMGEAQ